MSEAGRRTTSRRELARHEHFEEVSPEVGELDETAFDDLLRDDPDEAMAMLADLTGATDAALRELARRLAGQIVLGVARAGQARARGIGRMEQRPYRPDAGDLDLDASLEPIAEARAAGALADVERLRVRAWAKRSTALCLLVDRSGSMGGRPLATSAVAAAAIAWRTPDDYSVLAFGNDVVVAKSQDIEKAAEHVISDVLALRGFGTTDVAGALRVAAAQLARSRGGRRVAVLLSDCRATVPGDVEAAAAALDELCIMAPAGDDEEARSLAAAVGARVASVAGPSGVPSALATLLDD